MTATPGRQRTLNRSFSSAGAENGTGDEPRPHFCPEPFEGRLRRRGQGRS